MPFTTASVTALNTTVTAASGAAAKVAALLPGLLDVIVKEICANGIVTPSQKVRLEDIRADLAANAATMQTALGL